MARIARQLRYIFGMKPKNWTNSLELDYLQWAENQPDIRSLYG